MNYEEMLNHKKQMEEAAVKLQRLRIARAANLNTVTITKSGKKDIALAISLLKREDRNDVRKIVAKVCEINWEKFVSDDCSESEDALGTYEYQMQRKKMSTTGAIEDQVVKYLSELLEKKYA